MKTPQYMVVHLTECINQASKLMSSVIHIGSHPFQVRELSWKMHTWMEVMRKTSAQQKLLLIKSQTHFRISTKRMGLQRRRNTEMQMVKWWLLLPTFWRCQWSRDESSEEIKLTLVDLFLIKNMIIMLWRSWLLWNARDMWTKFLKFKKVNLSSLIHLYRNIKEVLSIYQKLYLVLINLCHQSKEFSPQLQCIELLMTFHSDQMVQRWNRLCSMIHLEISQHGSHQRVIRLELCVHSQQLTIRLHKLP